MASETVSLCWDNFHKNMCTGMSSLLKNEDLVDVTIAVEGKYFKAHKMVLSLCSPYFRELFKVNPCKHPIVFMKDVSYSAMSDLLHFMYYGEVQVNKENVSTFRKTAEALQITGLNTNGNLTKVGQHTVNEEKHAPPSEIDHQDSGIAQENYVSVKMEPNDDPAASSTLADDELYDPLCEENVDDFTEDYSMIEEEDTKPGTSAEISISSTQVGGSFLGEDQDTHQDVVKHLPREKSLPEKSKEYYMKVYSDFKDWCQRKCVTEVSENDLLVYFHEKAESRKASSLWSIFSMLKQTLKLKENVNITKYYKVIAFLKKKNVSYTPKKAAVFEREQIRKFITEAPDEIYLSTKVILIVGVAGACRTDELCNMKVSDIDVRKDRIIINVPHTQTKSSKIFAIEESLWIDVLKKYLAKRPSPDMEKLLIGFRFGKPTRQNMGHNTISNAANKIAKYLKLPNAASYSGYSLRRTSAAMGGWKSSSTAAISDKEGSYRVIAPGAPIARLI